MKFEFALHSLHSVKLAFIFSPPALQSMSPRQSGAEKALREDNELCTCLSKIMLLLKDAKRVAHGHQRKALCSVKLKDKLYERLRTATSSRCTRF